MVERALSPIFRKLWLLFEASQFDNAVPVKTFLKIRLGSSAWSLSLGEYVILLVAVLGGWLAGRATSPEPVFAGYAPAHHLTSETNAPGINPGAVRRLSSE